MKNIILKNSIFGGLIVSAVLVFGIDYMMKNPDFEPSMVAGFISMSLAFLFSVLGIYQHRKLNNGIISFGQAFKTGLLIAFLISTIYVVTWLVMYYNFYPDFMEKFGEMTLKRASAEELAAKKTELAWMEKAYKSPLAIIGLTYAEIFPLGIVMALIGALILKKK
ncbi:DUF4199 domain-containing protein [Flavobacterium terrigena]|uniref:DUF4199 domain-containing protein n=1 Tax=Flavobacterium terrigena TaxID=402734 RepID=A0A1H6QHG3_9FLAO|nr:DUF4199 domain-containing protein [Flavobacterium terrigena]SEI43161.1 Protein of unknown function [Flavobacterium terrigena]